MPRAFSPTSTSAYARFGPRDLSIAREVLARIGMPRAMGERSGLGPATPAEQRTEPDDVRYIHEPVRRIWRYVVARGRRRDGLAEGRRYCTDIGNIPEAVIV